VKTLLKRLINKRIRTEIRRVASKRLRQTFETLSINIARKSDYYSPLPTESQLIRNVAR
jgi:hypothetical protein